MACLAEPRPRSLLYNRDMGALDRLESFLQDLMERPAWLLMPRRLHPLKLATALTKELEGQTVRRAGRALVPATYDVFLNPEDWNELGSLRATLEAELTDYVSRLAEERDLTLMARPAVRIERDPSVRQGEARAAAVLESGANLEAAGGREEAGTVYAPPRPTATEQLSRAHPQPLRPVPSQPAALVLLGPEDEELQRFPIDRSMVTIGRRSSNDIAVPDLKVSREHARLEIVGRHYYVTDLQSTNGTLINGREVQGRQELVPGDVIEIGRQRLRFES